MKFASKSYSVNRWEIQTSVSFTLKPVINHFVLVENINKETWSQLILSFIC